jgi:hypothetical protein
VRANTSRLAELFSFSFLLLQVALLGVIAVGGRVSIRLAPLVLCLIFYTQLLGQV